MVKEVCMGIKNEGQSGSAPVECRRCQHFHVTWNAQRPYACHLYGFESKILPCQVVKRESGTDCLGFSPKQRSSEESASKVKDSY